MKRISSPVKAIQTLKERGLLYGKTFGDDVLWENYQQRHGIYCGFDPTADSLHLGNLVTLIAMAHFQEAGFHAVGLIGGATGLIGDPSGRMIERQKSIEEKVDFNCRALTKQLESFDFLRNSGSNENEFKIVNNISWFSQLSCIHFLRDIGRGFKVQSMLSRDSVKSRLERQEGINYAEFSYQILQAYDFNHLSQYYGCNWQLGGQDQMGNIVSGLEFSTSSSIDSKSSSSSSSSPSIDLFGVTVPLLLSEKGEKFGKSAGNSIWLDERKTSCFDLYQYLFNTSDQMVHSLLLKLTFLPISEISQILGEHLKCPEKRLAQKSLAYNVTKLIHGEKGVEKAKLVTQVIFSNERRISDIPGKDLVEAFQGLSIMHEIKAKVWQEMDVLGLLMHLEPDKSKGECKRLIKSGCVILNGSVQVKSPLDSLSSCPLIEDRLLVLSVGKKRHFAIMKSEEYLSEKVSSI